MRLLSHGAFAAAVFVCALGALTAAARPARADDTITLMGSTASPGIYDALEFVAQKQGYYAAEHLNIVKQYVNSPSVAAQLVASGRGDICTASAEAILQGYEKGLHLEYFMSHAARFSNVLAVRDDSPIRTLEDFRGKNIGLISVGSAGEVTADVMLAGAGVRASEVTFSPIGMGPAAIQAVADKRIDAVAYPYGEIVPIEVVANLKMRVFRDPILKDIVNAGIAAAPATIQARGDVLARFARALVKASIFVRENPAVTARDFLEGAGDKVTPESLRIKTLEIEMLEDDLPGHDPMNPRIGYMSPEGLAIFSRTLADYGRLHSTVPIAAIVTNQFIPFANDFDRKALIAQARAAR
jgi:NitT/TauT family transport system substrate-binding protein